MDVSSSDDEPETRTTKFVGARKHREAADDDDLDGSTSDSSDSDQSEEEMLAAQVADVPFEELTAMKGDGRGTVKLPGRSKQAERLKRANKNRPRELPAKRQVPRFREVVSTAKKVIRDPRFESLTGKFDEKAFKESYRFIYDEQLPVERQRLKKLVKKERNPDRKHELQQQLAKIEAQIKDEARRRQQAERETERKRKAKDAIKQGKKPFFLKAADKRKEELVEKYKELKAAGKLDAFLAKRRKKNAAKDHRFIPYRRQEAGGDS
ncbi:hypothetical protein KFL_002250060 [Klebsormidium nitens]|uniref:rRNA biogenesis protein RRP36 n=1 Tax=Klebsormidium nitens TaxID=105231 RepID=A0A1Y1I959_KLENI|nr:hypothetical protein KFL_002250060 [Klebsormidium nitens]|eukprot:GAQ85226.1 hypothetical protein KFL_002250060 [Klebsormidium nitens]